MGVGGAIQYHLTHGVGTQARLREVINYILFLGTSEGKRTRLSYDEFWSVVTPQTSICFLQYVV